ncbi:MAG: hypothetical protein E5V36_03200 [Mesorhizobium sp.]|nr:MAG: hypothetical protein E5V36_03200 [Mesorhizobium sp.]
MEIDTDKIDDAVLGLLWLTLHEERRAWKGLDWNALDRLYEKGLIANPANKAKSVVLTDEGLACGEAMPSSVHPPGAMSHERRAGA